MKEFRTERIAAHELFPFPEEGRLIEETPPCLSWLLQDGRPICTVVLENERGEEIWRGSTEKNYTVPDCTLTPGLYRWNIYTPDTERGWQSFRIAENAVAIHRVTARALYDAVPSGHPRHLFLPEDIPALLASRKTELEVLRRNIALAYEDGIPARPMFHRDPNALPYREYFGRFRDFCDRDLIACALGYALLGDETAGAHARELLLTICDWNPSGPCSLEGKWGDEVGLSCARCLPSAYDLLYPLLTPAERDYVAHTVHTYALQCHSRLRHLDYCANPGDSHAGRLPAYLGEAALVLKDSGAQSEEEALAWLDYTLDIYGGIFPYYGTPDGGWAEGTFYSSSYTRWYLPFFCAVERYTDCRFLDRPFYQRLTQYFLHFASPDFENHPFGDGYWCRPSDAEWPGFFAQNPCRLYAARFGPSLACDRAADAAVQDIYLLHLLDIFIPDGTPPITSLTEEATDVAAFPDAGFVSLHTALAAPASDVAVLARASRFGSDSHRHPDQGSFALFVGGSAIFSPSGYFGRRYGTKHHKEWLNATRAHNVLLIDGEGQKPNSLEPQGKILYARDNGDTKETEFDLSAAYPMLRAYTRHISLSEDTVLITDTLEADHAVTITYPLHTLSCPIKEENAVTVARGDAVVTATPIEGDLTGCEVSDRFAVDLNEGEPEAYHVTMPQQYHITWQSPARTSHRIVMRIDIRRTT